MLGFQRTKGFGKAPAFAAEQRTTRRFGKIAGSENERRGRESTWKIDCVVSFAFDFGDSLECEPIGAPGGVQLPLQAASDLCEELSFARGERFFVERAIEDATQGEKAVEGGREEEIVELCEHFHVQYAQQNAFGG